MAEVAGLVVGDAGLAVSFESCIGVFERVESGANYGTEYEKAALRISLLELRLSRWAQNIRFAEL